MAEPFSRLDTHLDYATRVRDVEIYQQQWKIPPGAEKFLASQTVVIDIIPKHEATSLLHGRQQRKLFASITVDPHLFALRSFAHELVPSLGTKEKMEADISKIEAIAKEQGEVKVEAEVFVATLHFIENKNQDIRTIRGNTSKFLQG